MSTGRELWRRGVSEWENVRAKAILVSDTISATNSINCRFDSASSISDLCMAGIEDRCSGIDFYYSMIPDINTLTQTLVPHDHIHGY